MPVLMLLCWLAPALDAAPVGVPVEEVDVRVLVGTVFTLEEKSGVVRVSTGTVLVTGVLVEITTGVLVVNGVEVVMSVVVGTIVVVGRTAVVEGTTDWVRVLIMGVTGSTEDICVGTTGARVVATAAEVDGPNRPTEAVEILDWRASEMSEPSWRAITGMVVVGEEGGGKRVVVMGGFFYAHRERQALCEYTEIGRAHV